MPCRQLLPPAFLSLPPRLGDVQRLPPYFSTGYQSSFFFHRQVAEVLVPGPGGPRPSCIPNRTELVYIYMYTPYQFQQRVLAPPKLLGSRHYGICFCELGFPHARALPVRPGTSTSTSGRSLDGCSHVRARARERGGSAVAGESGNRPACRYRTSVVLTCAAWATYPDLVAAARAEGNERKQSNASRWHTALDAAWTSAAARSVRQTRSAQALALRKLSRCPRVAKRNAPGGEGGGGGALCNARTAQEQDADRVGECGMRWRSKLDVTCSALLCKKADTRADTRL